MNPRPPTSITTAHVTHVAFWVHDLDAMCRLYSDTFGAVAGALYTNPSTGFSSRFLSLGSGARLELMARSTLRPVGRDH